MEKIEPALYIVPTPVGNLQDMTLRAVNTLRAVDIIACEDTRHSGMLLQNLKIPGKKLISYHEHNEAKKAEDLVSMIKQGNSIALVSDAGTPLVSDPGYRLVNAAVKHNVKIVPLPGATAFVPALAASGFPTDKFCFLGFPPQKKGRKTFLDGLEKYSEMSIILYESPHRIVKLLGELNERYTGRLEVCVAREISKIYEEIISGKVEEIFAEFEKRQTVKGEIVVVLNMQES
jgi:16S rRNA (cytidine1402-2'-O)-methyltransferase